MTVKTVDVSDTQLDLRELLSLIREGYEIILMDGDTPVARLSPIGPRGRIPGLHPGGWISEDFDEPLPDEFWLGGE